MLAQRIVSMASLVACGAAHPSNFPLAGRLIGPAGGQPRLVNGGGQGGGGGRQPRATPASGSGGDGNKRWNAWDQYLELLDTRPLLTRAATCGLLTVLGDTFCQLVVESSQLDIKRVVSYSAIGFFLTGPVLYQLYLFIERMAPGTSLRSVLTAVAIDQLIFQPPWIALLMTIVTTAEGKPETLWPKLQQDWVPAVKTSWMIWMPAQYVNFKFVPLNLRVTFDAVVALLWNVYLSFQTHRAVTSVS